jgi:hypothetical protein
MVLLCTEAGVGVAVQLSTDWGSCGASPSSLARAPDSHPSKSLRTKPALSLLSPFLCSPHVGFPQLPPPSALRRALRAALHPAATMSDAEEVTVERLPELLKNDNAVKVAGVDVDGILRGKLMAKKKFLSIAQEGFGFCSVIFGWDMHDQTYFRELGISNKENGYRDVIAIPDLSSFRRIPWENNVPFFLISFHDPDTGGSLSACPRSLLRRTVAKLQDKGYGAMAGGESPLRKQNRCCALPLDF